MISSCGSHPQLDPEMTAARAHACLLTARDDAVLCSTPCFSCSAVLLFLCRSPRVAYRRASARASRSLARRLDRGTQNQQCSARAFLWFFAVKTFFFSSSGAPQASEILGWTGRAGEARLMHWGWPQRPPSAGAGGHPAVPRRGTLLRRRRKFFELVAG